MTQAGDGTARSDTYVSLCEMEQLAKSDERVVQEKLAAYYKVSGFISHVMGGDSNRPLSYLACETCKKRVIDENDGYRCENC